jgi:hypothetical protein
VAEWSGERCGKGILCRIDDKDHKGGALKRMVGTRPMNGSENPLHQRSGFCPAFRESLAPDFRDADERIFFEECGTEVRVKYSNDFVHRLFT